MRVLKAFAAALGLALPAQALAQSQPAQIEVGYLKCDQTGSGGNFLVATEEFRCVFDPAKKGAADQNYTGVITKWGITLENIEKRSIRWVVLASHENLLEGALGGDYGGIGADVTLGAGLGANALIGGSGKSIALQPLSVSTQSGIGLAASVKTLTLNYIAAE